MAVPTLLPRHTYGSGPAEPPSLDADGGGNDWVDLARAANDIDAQLLLGRLHLAGIETCAVKDRSARGAFLYGGRDPWAPVMILVRRAQLEDGRFVLAEIAYEG